MKILANLASLSPVGWMMIITAVATLFWALDFGRRKKGHQESGLQGLKGGGGKTRQHRPTACEGSQRKNRQIMLSQLAALAAHWL